MTCDEEYWLDLGKYKPPTYLMKTCQQTRHHRKKFMASIPRRGGSISGVQKSDTLS